MNSQRVSMLHNIMQVPVTQTSAATPRREIILRLNFLLKNLNLGCFGGNAGSVTTNNKQMLTSRTTPLLVHMTYRNTQERRESS